MSVAGCTTVSSAQAPDTARSRRFLVPDAAVRPSVLTAPVSEPAGHAALVRTGPERTHRPRPAAAPRRGPVPVRAARLVPPPRTAAPAAPPVRHPRPQRRPPARHPVPRPRPTATVGMRDVCREADGVAAPEIVQLCHDVFG